MRGAVHRGYCRQHAQMRGLLGPLPIGTRVESTESGWTGEVVRHVRASVEDGGQDLTEVVRWDRTGVEGKVRPGRLRPL